MIVAKYLRFATGQRGASNRILSMGPRLPRDATAQMAADKEAAGLSRVHMYESKCILPLRDNGKKNTFYKIQPILPFH